MSYLTRLVDKIVEAIEALCECIANGRSVISNTIAGNTIAVHSAGGTVTNINESITSIVDNGDGTFTYTDESGTATAINPFASLNEYDNKVDASAGGVGSGELFVASQTNSMGAIPGTIIRR